MQAKIYLVGGAVRDQLLGREVKDRDWVVVGSTPEKMIQEGFIPVGKDFPVFLHPQTHEEYALARTERKTAAGYRGFQVYATPDVTLEQDLARRDITINAMALEPESGQIIDPYHGQQDLTQGILRHVSDAFVEDPVRILRIARFAARYQFSVAPETMKLIQRMVDNGEVDALVSERVLQELMKGLMEQKPSLMLQILEICGALNKVLPEIGALFNEGAVANLGEKTLSIINHASEKNLSLTERTAALFFYLDHPYEQKCYTFHSERRTLYNLDNLNQRLKLPKECYDLARLAILFREDIVNIKKLTGEQIITLLMQSDAYRREERFHQLLNICSCAYTQTSNFEHIMTNWQTALEFTSRVDSGKIVQETENKKDIPQNIFNARCQSLQNFRPI